ncbi:MAG: hypothetical protein JXQ90_01625 [Cyclobacteriaceae bacterium]
MKFKTIICLSLLLWALVPKAQELPERLEFVLHTNTSIKLLASELQRNKRKIEHTSVGAMIDMSYLVYEQAMAGKRPFGRVQYQIELRENSDHVKCVFKDFKFQRYVKSARYGRMVPVGGTQNDPGSQRLKYALNEIQLGLIEWKTDWIITKKMERLSAFEFSTAMID